MDDAQGDPLLRGGGEEIAKGVSARGAKNIMRRGTLVPAVLCLLLGMLPACAAERGLKAEYRIRLQMLGLGGLDGLMRMEALGDLTRVEQLSYRKDGSLDTTQFTIHIVRPDLGVAWHFSSSDTVYHELKLSNRSGKVPAKRSPAPTGNRDTINDFAVEQYVQRTGHPDSLFGVVVAETWLATNLPREERVLAKAWENETRFLLSTSDPRDEPPGNLFAMDGVVVKFSVRGEMGDSLRKPPAPEDTIGMGSLDPLDREALETGGVTFLSIELLSLRFASLPKSRFEPPKGRTKILDQFPR